MGFWFVRFTSNTADTALFSCWFMLQYGYGVNSSVFKEFTACWTWAFVYMSLIDLILHLCTNCTHFTCTFSAHYLILQDCFCHFIPFWTVLCSILLLITCVLRKCCVRTYVRTYVCAVYYSAYLHEPVYMIVLVYDKRKFNVCQHWFDL